MSNKHAYAYSGYLGGACSNSVRVRRARVEQVVLDPIRDELLAPERVARMAAELHRAYAICLTEAERQTSEQPASVHVLDERLARLRERLTVGDPGMEPDEIKAAIDRVETKRRELLNALPAAKESAKLLSVLPKAAELYRRQIVAGLDDNPRAALKARVILRQMLCERISLMPDENGGLWAEYAAEPAALLKRPSAPLKGQLVAGASFAPSLSYPYRVRVK